MVKGLKPLIILSAVILVAIIACYLLLFVFPGANTDTDEPDDSSVSSSSNIYVISENSDELLSYEVMPSEGESFLVEYSRDSEGNYSYAVTPAAPNFDYDTSKFRSMLYTLSSVSTTTIVEEDAKNLDMYGLESPSCTVRTRYSDGTVIDILIGNKTLVDNFYYAKTNQSEDVFTLGSYLVSLLTRTDMDYRQITLFPAYEEDDVYTNINWFKLTLRDGTEIEIEAVDPTEYEDASASEYIMHSPAETFCNTTVVQELLDDLSLIESSYIVGDVSDADLAVYGLDQPARMEMTDINGNSVDLLIGCKTAAGSEYYYTALSSAPNTVIVSSGAAFTWFDINYIELMNRVIWLYDITDIASFDYDLPNGEKHTVELEHSTKESEVSEGTMIGVVTAEMDGESISEENARRLYVRSCNFRISGELTEADVAALGSEVYCSITLNFVDGTSSTLELIRMNDRQYACRIDGVASYYTNVKNITTLTDAIQTVLDGGTLSMSYDSY